MDLMQGGMEEFVVPETLFESLENLDYDNYNNNNNSLDTGLFSDLELDLSSDTMTSFMEMENIMEVEPVVKTEQVVTRPSVIMKTKQQEKVTTPSLSEILTSCGIEYDMVESPVSSSDMVESPVSESSAASSPASCHMDPEMERNQELINDLEDFFMKTEGQPTVVKDTAAHAPVSPSVPMSPPVTVSPPVTDVDLSLAELNNAVTTNMVTEDGQNVVIIIAPSSPCDSVPLSSPGQLESDPEWSPSPASVTSINSERPRKKYQRSKPPKCPSGPYPTDKKERKKAQNRTAAFRYREKMKNQQDGVEEELEALEERNINLKEKLTEMETEFKYLKKLMMEAGLGQYAAVASY